MFFVHVTNIRGIFVDRFVHLKKQKKMKRQFFFTYLVCTG
jgi:hypothetical protein